MKMIINGVLYRVRTEAALAFFLARQHLQKFAMSVCPQETTQRPLIRFSCNFIFGNILKLVDRWQFFLLKPDNNNEHLT
jgi:hypothetical protein